MEKSPDFEHIVARWLDDDISTAELNWLKEQPEFNAYAHIATTAKQLELRPYNRKLEFSEVNKRLSEQINNKRATSKYFKSIAVAVILIAFLSTIVVFNPLDTTKHISADIAALQHRLPDGSEVQLNSNSSISYSEDDWTLKRLLTLDGEAYFNVKKGQSFTVKTNKGTIDVLGTRFNVKVNNNRLTVICYSGQVQVRYKHIDTQLLAGQRTSITPLNEAIISTVFVDAPIWVNNTFRYKSKNLKQVIIDLETYYNISVTLPKSLESLKFSGVFTTSDKQKALQSICLPLGLTFKTKSDHIIISKTN